jgi:hypothetical protein
MKGLFWLMVSEASVFMAGRTWSITAVHFMVARKETEREREKVTAPNGSLPFPLLFYPAPQPVKLGPPTFRVGTPKGFFTNLLIQPSLQSRLTIKTSEFVRD